MKFNFSFGDFSRASFNWAIPLLKKTVRANLDFYSTPDKFAMGITSRCRDGLHVLFFDYDYLDSDCIEAEIKRLQKDFKLSHAFLFALDRRNSYHVIILDKFTMKGALEVLQCASIDAAFISAPIKLFYRAWVLRIGVKGSRKPPEFLRVIKSPFDQHGISLAHKKFLERYYGVPELSYKNPDGSEELPIINYNTANRTWL